MLVLKEHWPLKVKEDASVVVKEYGFAGFEGTLYMEGKGRRSSSGKGKRFDGF